MRKDSALQVTHRVSAPAEVTRLTVCVTSHWLSLFTPQPVCNLVMAAMLMLILRVFPCARVTHCNLQNSRVNVFFHVISQAPFNIRQGKMNKVIDQTRGSMLRLPDKAQDTH